MEKDIIISDNGTNLKCSDKYFKDFFSEIKIKKEIINKVNFFCESHDIKNNVLGLHIQATDNGEIYPESWINRIIEMNKDKLLNVFICSDSNESKEFIEKKLIEKIENINIKRFLKNENVKKK